MTTLTPVSSLTTATAEDATRIEAHRRRERFTDHCFSTITLTLLLSSAFYAVSQLFTLAF